jgi:hypothetical protein
MQVIPDFPLAAQVLAMVPTSARLGEKEVLQKGLDVDSQPVGPMRITLGKPTTISGKIVDAAGQPVAGQMILFVSATGTGGGAISNAEGAFQASLRAAGEYHLYALPDQNWAADPDYLKEHEKDFPVVRIVAGENPPILLRWTKSGPK